MKNYVIKVCYCIYLKTFLRIPNSFFFLILTHWRHNLVKSVTFKKKIIKIKTGHAFGMISKYWFKKRSQNYYFYDLIRGYLWLFVIIQNFHRLPNLSLSVVIRGYSWLFVPFMSCNPCSDLQWGMRGFLEVNRPKSMGVLLVFFNAKCWWKWVENVFHWSFLVAHLPKKSWPSISTILP